VSEALTYEEWRKNRGTYIGGSDLAAILGIHPYRDIGTVWIEKVRAQERLEQEDETIDPEIETRFSRWGKRQERVIIEEYADVTGFKVETPGLQVFRHPEYPFIGGTIDGDAETPFGDHIVVEAKSRDAFAEARARKEGISGTYWGDEGTDQVPEWFVPQGMQYMMVRGYETRCDYPVLIGGNNWKLYHVEYDRELAAQLIDVQIWFWGLVTRREAPPMDFSAAGATKLQKRIHDKIIGETRVVTEEREAKRILQLIALRDYAHEQGLKWVGDDNHPGIKGECTAELLSIIGDNARLEIPIPGQKRPIAINRKPKAGYTNPEYYVQPSITMSFEPYHLKKRKELFSEIKVEVEKGNEEQKRIEDGGRPAADE
jgi:predicted phage-related endonuclease